MTDQASRAAEPVGMSLAHMVWGQAINQAVYVVARLGIADLLQDGEKTAEELAAAVGANPVNLGRVLRALTTLGVFREDEAGRFTVGPEGARLAADHPRSLRAMALMISAPFCWRAWGQMYDAVKTGTPAFDQVHGQSLFQYLRHNPEDAALFNAAMTVGTTGVVERILEVYDFSGCSRVVDVGGGHGALLRGILEQYEHLTGVLSDLPEVIAGADLLRDSPAAGRCELVAMDFFTGVPAGGDVYILKEILHDWNDEQVLAILRNCREGIREGGRVLHIGSVLAPPNLPDMGRWTDLTMLTFLPGRERTEAEFRELYAAAGFRLSRVIPIVEDWCIVEGITA